MKKFSLYLASSITILGLVGCSGTIQATPTPQPRVTTTIVSTATSTVGNTTPVATKSFSFEGVSLSYSEAVVKTVKGEKLAATPYAEGPGLGEGNPQRIRIAFIDKSTNDWFSPREPQIVVYPVDEYKKLFPEVGEMITTLKAQLDAQSEPNTKSIVFLPPLPASQVFAVQRKYAEFKNGKGIRFITYYSQGVNEITNEDVFYTFQGITADGKYYISLVYPITTTLLPNAINEQLDYEMFAETYGMYIDKLTKDLNALSASSFTPDLNRLDEMVASLNVEPTGL